MNVKKKMVFFDIDYTLFDTALFKKSGLQTHQAYDEIGGMLEELSTIATLGIFSEGEKAFQEKKLSETNLQNFFQKKNRLIYAKKDMSSLIELKKTGSTKIFLVDDKLSVLKDAKEMMQKLVTIWVKRGPYAQAAQPIPGFTPDETVTDLKDIVSIVQQKN